MIALSELILAEADVLFATVAHELAHVHLLGDKRLSADHADHEQMTDLLTIFFGLGIFPTAHAARL